MSDTEQQNQEKQNQVEEQAPKEPEKQEKQEEIKQQAEIPKVQKVEEKVEKQEKKKPEKENEAEREEGDGEQIVHENHQAIAENFYYEEDHKEQELEDSPLTHKLTEFNECFGFDSNKKYNINLLDDENIIYSVGVTYHILNLVTKEVKVYFCKDQGGIGSIQVHPSKKYFAVAEKGNFPHIYIYEYPSLKLYRILRKGTEKSYSSITFSSSGNQLASVGSYPDYTISLWDWRQEIIVLKSKAFSQEVFNVGFSLYSEFFLTTSGQGHIKFWKVAETFTGLKLKGLIAKFGQVEISDVVAYYIYQDGKVLSGTEYGKLLLWEGNLIKSVVSQNFEMGLDCHKGAINVIFKKENDIVTAGEDGYIRFWDSSLIDNAEADDRGCFYITPNAEIKLYSDDDQTVPANILHIVTNPNFWIVQDANGKLIKLVISENKQDYEATTIMMTNSGQMRDIAVPDQLNCAVTVGEDGAVRLWDYVNAREYYKRSFKGQGTCLEWLSYSKKNQGRVLIAGYSTGIVRYLLLNQDKFFLLKCLKVHNKPIKFIRSSADGSLVCVVSTEGNIFILENHATDLQNIDPFCLWETNLKINDCQWDKAGEKVLLACQDGYCYEIKVPKKQDCDNSQTYLKSWVPSKKYKIKMMEFQKPKTEEMDLKFLLNKKEDKKIDEEWDPAPIMSATYYDTACTKILVAAEGKYLGYWYICDWDQERPINFVKAPKINTSFFKFMNYSDWLLVGFQNGTIQIRHKFDLNNWLQIGTHDKNYGKVNRVVLNHEKNCILSSAEDGTIYTYKLDDDGFLRSAKGELINEYSFKQLSGGVSEGTFADQIQVADLDEEDIIDDSVYSIQEAKLLAEEDYKKKEADKKKQKVLKQIKELVEKFEGLKNKNLEIDEIARMTWEEMTVDPEYIQMLKKRVEEDMEETRMEVKWDAEYTRLMLEKLMNYVKQELEVDTFTVKALKNSKIKVQTFKVKKTNDYLKKNLEHIYKLIEEEKKSHELQAGQKGGAGQTLQGDATFKLENKKGDQQEDKKENQQQELQMDEKLTGAKAERMKHKLEEARIKQQLDELEKTKPTKESFEPESAKAVKEALETLGDYKLKSNPTYDVPENERMNVSKKRKYMFLLEEFIYNIKMKFNNTIISLRERKKNIITKIQNYNIKIQEINQQLGLEENLFSPQIEETLEYPDNFLKATEDEIDEFEIWKAQEAAKAKNKGGYGGMGGGGGQQQEQDSKKQQNDNDKKKKKEEQKKDGKDKKKTETDQQKEQFKARKGAKVQHSDLEEEMKHIKNMILNAEKQRMIDEINEDIELFDNDIISCQNERNILESDFTIIAQMKLVTYYQELLVLIDMEEWDNKLINNLLNCKQERTRLQDEGDKITNDLTNLVNRDLSNEKELNEQLKLFKENVFVEDDHKREKVKQYYIRKYKKTKAKTLKNKNQEEEGEEVEDEEGDSDEDEDEDFLEDDDDEKLDTSPVEQDTRVREIMDKICELEDNQETNRKEKMDLERQKASIGTRIEKLMKDLKKAEDELKEFQRKKLRKVNQLDVSYTIRLDQIQNLNQISETQIQLPESLDKSILFTQTEFNRLCKRIKELEQEQKKIQNNRGRLKYMENKLQKQIIEKEAKYVDLNKKYEEKHILKFGDLIDLKVLDALQPTKQVLDMREKFKDEERQAILRVEKAKNSLLEKKKELLEAKRQNTKIIQRITQLGQEQLKLNKKLDSTNKQLFKDEGNEEKKNKSDLERERQNLKDLVKFLSKEIEDLKTEIGLFKRKGGHIYTMVTSNKKTFN